MIRVYQNKNKWRGDFSPAPNYYPTFRGFLKTKDNPKNYSRLNCDSSETDEYKIIPPESYLPIVIKD